MKVVVTGGAGFLGRRLAAALLTRGALSGADGGEQAIDELTLFDVVAPEPPLEDGRVRVVTGDVADREGVAALIGDGVDSIFHLAAVVSGEAEQNFELGLSVNLHGTMALLEACRGLDRPPRLVFASSIAAFGGELPEVIGDATPLNPQTSYGNQKAMAELLVSDYSRKGFIDGRALRLPTIVVRGGKPNKAASGFASSIVREPLSGIDYVCPVRPESRMWILSPRRAVAAFLRAHELPSEAWGVNRVLTLPGLSVSMAETVEAMARVAGAAAAERVSWELDATVQKMVDGWPNRFDPARALGLGFEADAGVDAVIAAFIEDDLGGRVASDTDS